MLKKYEVTLMATSFKDVCVYASSEQEAVELVRNMYCTTDVLAFTDDDVEEIEVQANEAEESPAAASVLAMDNRTALRHLLTEFCLQ